MDPCDFAVVEAAECRERALFGCSRREGLGEFWVFCEFEVIVLSFYLVFPSSGKKGFTS